jgi:hypothetical protein
MMGRAGLARDREQILADWKPCFRLDLDRDLNFVTATELKKTRPTDKEGPRAGQHTCLK